MNFEYIDNHAHLNLDKFNEDRGEVLNRSRDAKVLVINVGTYKESSKLAVEIAEQNENCFAIVGLHPTDTDEDFDYEYYKKLCEHPKVVGIGECGLDYFHLGDGSKEKQKNIFEEHIKLAIEMKKPLMLHVREAYKDALKVLKKYPDVRGNVHFFAGTLEEAKEFIDIGFTISFTGVITFAKEYEKLVEALPLDKILSETDCPYVAPIPYRGKRNEPVYVVEVIKKIAEIKKLPQDEVKKQLLENGKKIWGIKNLD